MGAQRFSTRRKFPDAAPDKSTHGSGKSEGAVGVSDVYQRGHNKAVFATLWWPVIARAAGNLAYMAAGKVGKHTGGKNDALLWNH